MEMWLLVLTFGHVCADVMHPHHVPGPEGFTHNIYDNNILKEYDFVVVGAGAAGATIANRLTEIHSWKVLLIEAGDEETELSETPLCFHQCEHTAPTWPGLRAEPQSDTCLCMKNQQCPLTVGRGMGGSTMVDCMLYSRGHKYDYQLWQKKGNDGWSWSTVLKYFLKSENANGDFVSPQFHFSGGYLDVERVPYVTRLANAFLKSGKQLGYKQTVDYNNGQSTGFSRVQAFLRHGTRCSASKAFLRPIRNSHNLHITKNVKVTKLYVDPKTLSAKGVKFQRQNGKFFQVKVLKEVILSAGAFFTPQLLMLAGIGPKEHLKKINIPVVKDLPGVGENLQDHVTMTGLTFLINETLSLRETKYYLKDIINRQFYGNIDRDGPLTSIGGIEAIANIHSKVSNSPQNYPDFSLLFQATNGEAFRRRMEMTDQCSNIYKKLKDVNAFTILPIINHPYSRGQVKLQNKNPKSLPLIYNNYFNDKRDMDFLIEAIRVTLKLINTPALQQYQSKLFTPSIPKCKKYKHNSNKYWGCLTRHLTTSLNSHCGTAKMGPESDKMAVVDHELRVHGVKKLRVVDSSVIPRIPSGYSSAATVMVAERAADLIKRYYFDEPYEPPNLIGETVFHDPYSWKKASKYEIDYDW